MKRLYLDCEAPIASFLYYFDEPQPQGCDILHLDRNQWESVYRTPAGLIYGRMQQKKVKEETTGLS